MRKVLKRSPRTGRVVCSGCGRGYGSEYDGICIDCRGGITAYDAIQKAYQLIHENNIKEAAQHLSDSIDEEVTNKILRGEL